MPSALTDAALARPRAVLGAVLGVLVLAGVIAAGTVGRVGLAPSEAVRSESERVADRFADRLAHEPAPALLVTTTGRQSIESPASRVALDVLTSRLRTTPGVVAVEQGPVSRDGRTTALAAYLRDDDPGTQRRAAAELREGLDPGGLEVAIGGQAGVLDDARAGVWGELARLELLALPATALVLLLAFGGRLVAAPLLSAATGVLGAAGAIGVINELTPVSALGIVAAAVVATVLGIEASLAIVARYRREAAALGGGEDALRRTMASAGRIVMLATVGAIAASACGALVPVLDERSVALGSALAAPLAAGVALAAAPSILVLSERSRPTSISPTEAGEGPGVWRKIELAVLRWRAPAAAAGAAAAAALVALASPGWGAETVPLDAAGLPEDSQARRAEVRTLSDLGSAVTAPVLLDAEDEADPRRLGRRLSARAGVDDVEPSPVGRDMGLLVAGTDARPGSLGARDAVEELRAADVEVGGRDAEALDADHALRRWLPIAAATCAIALAAIVFVALGGALRAARRIACAALLGVASMLPAAAAGGLLALVFGDGRLTGLFDYEPQGGPILGAVIAALVAVTAVSALRTAAFAALLAEHRGPGLDPRTAIAGRSAAALEGATAATVVGALGAAALVGSDLLAGQQLGLGVAAGVVLDLVLVRVLLAPGIARLIW